MALHDVSKGEKLRKLPRPNQNDAQAQRMAHNTIQTTFRQEGEESQPRLVHKNAMILTYDDENRVSSVYGYIPELSAVPVLIIANEGEDVFVDILGIDPPTV